MPKAYLVTTYRSIKKPEALAAYAKIAAPAMRAAGGRFLVRGMPAKVYELGMNERTVVVEFESLAMALAAYESLAYQEALRVQRRDRVTQLAFALLLLMSTSAASDDLPVIGPCDVA